MELIQYMVQLTTHCESITPTRGSIDNPIHYKSCEAHNRYRLLAFEEPEPVDLRVDTEAGTLFRQ